MKKIDVVSFGYSENYAVDASFDLNQLRCLRKVREASGTYVDDAEHSNISINIGKLMADSEVEAEEKLSEHHSKEAKQYQQWWTDERAKNEELKKQFECIQQQLDQIKGE